MLKRFYMIIFVVQQNYFQICIYLDKFLDISVKSFFLCSLTYILFFLRKMKSKLNRN